MAGTDLNRGGNNQVQRPTDVFSAIRNEMDRMFQRFELGLPSWPSARSIGGGMLVPDIDVRDDGKQIAVDVDLPGVDEKDINVTLANGVLTIKGEKKNEREEKADNYYLCERSYGSFQRSLRLPDTIDEGKLEARFDKGVLKISAPVKPEAQKTEKRIEIKNN
jgi:HSP20 family protein